MITSLRRAYAVFSKQLLDTELPAVEFVEGTSKRIFVFTPPNTIEVGLGIMNATEAEVLDDLLHAIAHVYNHHTGHPDITNRTYHKLSFCQTALRMGLVVVFQKNKGWFYTTSDPMKVPSGAIARFPEEAAVQKRMEVYQTVGLVEEILSEYQRELVLASQNKKQCQYKYVCACIPPVIVRVGRRPDSPRPFAAVCTYCDSHFRLDDLPLKSASVE